MRWSSKLFYCSPTQEDEGPGDQWRPPARPLQPAGEERERHPGPDRGVEVHRPRVPAWQPLRLLDQDLHTHQPSHRSHLRNKGSRE